MLRSWMLQYSPYEGHLVTDLVVVGGASARLSSTVFSATTIVPIFPLSPMSLLPKDQKLEANERMGK